MRRDYPGQKVPTYSHLQSSERLRVSLERSDKCVLNCTLLLYWSSWCYHIIGFPSPILPSVSLHLYTWTLLIFMCSFSSSLSAALLALSSTLQVPPRGRMLRSLTRNPFTANYFPICKVKDQRAPETAVLTGNSLMLHYSGKCCPNSAI